MELIYSPDEKGYYYQRYSDWKTTRVYRSRTAAEKAAQKGRLRFR